ncbi:MAG: lipid A export permease/ATP-binding protein MsbA [Methylococcales bacterium]|jgi:ATP-binding cassette, subfamily B, bacterial MsbA|nr:lipid A export permease/ATP-binding protein MsbA [Methylococcales bacterium]MBT7409720.1 lipid A export permease/ATP-binding protein MsbA [Methylococcales bacterium]
MNSKALYLRLLGYAKPHWKIFVFAIISMIVLAATEPAMPALMKPLLDGSFVEKDPEMIRLIPILLIIIFIIRGITNFISTVGMNWISHQVVMELRQGIFNKIITLPAHYFDNHSTGSIISKLTYDAVQVASAATEVLVTVVKDSFAVIGLLAWMFYINWQLSLIMFIVGPLIAFIVSKISRRLRTLNKSLQDSMGDITQVLDEALNGFKVMKIFGGQNYEKDRFNHVSNWIRRYTMKTIIVNNASMPVVQLVTVTALSIIIYFASLQSAAGEITVGGFVSLIGAMAMLFSPIKRLTAVNEKLQRGLAAAESVFNMIDLEAEEDQGNKTLSKVQGKIEINNLTFSYLNQEKPALKNFSLNIDAGTTVALVGPSGSGKSTLANLLPRFYSAQQGDIFVDNINIKDVTLENLRQQLAFVSQDIVLFNDTIKANIAYGELAQSADAEIIKAAESAHAMEFINRQENGLDTVIGEKGAMLSGGQRQRIAIARAFLKNAPILILDEATSALDSESERNIQESLEQLKQGKTTIIIAHRLSTIEKADCIIVLKEGEAMESGTHQALIDSNGLYASLYQTQFSN